MSEYRLQELLHYIVAVEQREPDALILRIKSLLVSLISYENTRIMDFLNEYNSDPVEQDHPNARIRQDRMCIIDALFELLGEDVTNIMYSHNDLSRQHQEIQQMDGVIAGFIQQHLCDDSRMSGLFGTSCSFFRYINRPAQSGVGDFLSSVERYFQNSVFFQRQTNQTSSFLNIINRHLQRDAALPLHPLTRHLCVTSRQDQQDIKKTLPLRMT